MQEPFWRHLLNNIKQSRSDFAMVQKRGGQEREELAVDPFNRFQAPRSSPSAPRECLLTFPNLALLPPLPKAHQAELCGRLCLWTEVRNTAFILILSPPVFGT